MVLWQKQVRCFSVSHLVTLPFLCCTYRCCCWGNKKTRTTCEARMTARASSSSASSSTRCRRPFFRPTMTTVKVNPPLLLEPSCFLKRRTKPQAQQTDLARCSCTHDAATALVHSWQVTLHETAHAVSCSALADSHENSQRMQKDYSLHDACLQRCCDETSRWNRSVALLSSKQLYIHLPMHIFH